MHTIPGETYKFSMSSCHAIKEDWNKKQINVISVGLKYESIELNGNDWIDNLGETDINRPC